MLQLNSREQRNNFHTREYRCTGIQTQNKHTVRAYRKTKAAQKTSRTKLLALLARGEKKDEKVDRKKPNDIMMKNSNHTKTTNNLQFS